MALLEIADLRKAFMGPDRQLQTVVSVSRFRWSQRSKWR